MDWLWTLKILLPLATWDELLRKNGRNLTNDNPQNSWSQDAQHVIHCSIQSLTEISRNWTRFVGGQWDTTRHDESLLNQMDRWHEAFSFVWFNAHVLILHPAIAAKTSDLHFIERSLTNLQLQWEDVSLSLLNIACKMT